jgi:dihydropteroate synthase
MGILNVTPDSFSDGGRYLDADAAVAHGLRLCAEGADILDVGGESTRPGAEPVSAAEEAARVLPVIERLAPRCGAPISVDTSKADVARGAIEAGACIINDVTALTADAGMARVAAETGAGVVLMHMRGTPRTMQEAPRYGDVVAEVREVLAERLADVVRQGVSARAVALDPGIGFGKTVEHNVRLLAHLPSLASLGRPVVVGASRKSFLGRITGRATAGERLPASLAALVFCALRGAHVLRVHDVRESCDALRVALALAAETEDGP